jgi:hypothetical protein
MTTTSSFVSIFSAFERRVASVVRVCVLIMASVGWK